MFKILNISIKDSLVIFILTLVISLLELLTISVVIPLLEILDRKNEITIFSGLSQLEFIIICLFCVLILFIIKSFFVVHISKRQLDKIYSIYSNLLHKVISNYFSKNNSSDVDDDEFKKFVTIELLLITYAFLCLVMMSTELFMILFITIYSIFNLGLNFFILLIVLFIFISPLMFILNKRSSVYGSEREITQTDLFSTIETLVSGSREIKLNRLTHYFKKLALVKNQRFISFPIKLKVLQILPRQFIEIIGIFFILAYFILQYFENINTTNFTDLLIYIFVFYRISLNATKLMSYLNEFSYFRNSIQNFKNSPILLEDKEDECNDQYCDFNNLEVRCLNIKYNQRSLYRKPINFNLNSSDKLFIHGKSGSGKTSLVDVVTRLVKPSSGNVIFNKCEKIDKVSFFYLSQKTFIFNDNLKNNITLFDRNIDETLLEKSIKLSLIFDKISSREYLSYQCGIDGKNLSGGERQRVGIARLFYNSLKNNSKLLVLDEVTSALDEKTEEIIMFNIMDQFKDNCVIFISHNHGLIKHFNCSLNIETQVFEK
jgi:ATP-binding cassette subfamily B protein